MHFNCALAGRNAGDVGKEWVSVSEGLHTSYNINMFKSNKRNFQMFCQNSCSRGFAWWSQWLKNTKPYFNSPQIKGCPSLTEKRRLYLIVRFVREWNSFTNIFNISARSLTSGPPPLKNVQMFFLTLFSNVSQTVTKLWMNLWSVCSLFYIEPVPVLTVKCCDDTSCKRFYLPFNQ